MSYADTTPIAFHRARGRARVIDVREPDEFTGDLGHIPGAELVPLATIAARAAAWSRDDELVVVCRAGARSRRAAAALAADGFRRVTNLDGGMLAYVAAGLPVERDASRTSQSRNATSLGSADDSGR